MEKQFQRKFMHPTRRKLADMVHSGEYESDTQVGWTKTDTNRTIGDTWEDEFHKYEKKEGYILKTSKNSDAYQEIREYVKKTSECQNSECQTIKFTNVDIKLIKRTSYCITCLAEIEQKIKLEGVWSEYQNYKIWTRMIVDGKLRLEQVKQAYDDLKQSYDYINEDGSTEKWVMPQSVDDVKAEMMILINNGEKEISDIEEKRTKAFEVLKEKHYEHYI